MAPPAIKLSTAGAAPKLPPHIHMLDYITEFKTGLKTPLLSDFFADLSWCKVTLSAMKGAMK